MKKKIFLIVSSLGAGGSERVYWLLAQYFDKEQFAVSVVFLNAREQCFSTDVDGVEFIDLQTMKASRSFYALLKLLRISAPYAVFSTTDHINILTALVACFVKIPNLIARASNNPQQMKHFYGFKARFYNLFAGLSYSRFDAVVCQSDEMRQSILRMYNINPLKLKVIANPVLPTVIVHSAGRSTRCKLVAVGRLSHEKGFSRLLEVMQELPAGYSLTIAGDGILMDSLKKQAGFYKLDGRVKFAGKIKDVPELISQHEILVLTSFTEGFPNVILEALSVGVPVVTFRVGGVDALIREGFNGFIVEQGDLVNLKSQIMRACEHPWQHEQIKADALQRFSLYSIGQQYANLLCN